MLLAGQQHLGLVQGLLFSGLLADEMEDVHHSPDSAPAPVAWLESSCIPVGINVRKS